MDLNEGLIQFDTFATILGKIGVGPIVQASKAVFILGRQDKSTKESVDSKIESERQLLNLKIEGETMKLDILAEITAKENNKVEKEIYDYHSVLFYMS